MSFVAMCGTVASTFNNDNNKTTQTFAKGRVSDTFSACSRFVGCFPTC